MQFSRHVATLAAVSLCGISPNAKAAEIDPESGDVTDLQQSHRD